MLIRVKVHPTNWQDREGLRYVYPRRRVPLYSRWARLALDGGSQSEPPAAYCRQWLGIEVVIVKRSNSAAGFSVLPNRWVVERTFAWFGLGKYRRLSKDYEALRKTSEVLV